MIGKQDKAGVADIDNVGFKGGRKLILHFQDETVLVREVWAIGSANG